MKKRIFIVLLLALGWNAASAGYFLETEEPEETAPPSLVPFSWGGGFSGAYYLSSIDFALNGFIQLRTGTAHALNLFTDLSFTDPVYEAGIDWHWFFGHQDYIAFGASGVVFEKSDSWKKAPRIFVGYGRDILPWKKAHFALRTSVRLSYLIGESLGREESYETKTAQAVIHGSVSILFF